MRQLKAAAAAAAQVYVSCRKREWWCFALHCTVLYAELSCAALHCSVLHLRSCQAEISQGQGKAINALLFRMLNTMLNAYLGMYVMCGGR